MKVNELDAQGDLKGPDTFELERIYVRNTHKGHGLGRFMVEQAIKMAIQRGKKQLWVGVWEKNLDAIEFYKRHGFTKISEHDFYMGTERQRDHVMALNLEPCIDPSG